MEIIDLLSGFNIDKLSDQDLQSLSRGIANTFILMPMDQILKNNTVFDEETERNVHNAAKKQVIAYLIKAVRGNLIDKAGMVLSVRKNIGKQEDFAIVKEKKIDPSPFVNAMSSMHFHHLSDEDMNIIAEEFAKLFLDNSVFHLLVQKHDTYTRESRVLIRNDILGRVYSAIKMLLASKDQLIDMAKESKAKAQKK